jgi:hypothetical protein
MDMTTDALDYTDYGFSLSGGSRTSALPQRLHVILLHAPQVAEYALKPGANFGTIPWYAGVETLVSPDSDTVLQADIGNASFTVEGDAGGDPLWTVATRSTGAQDLRTLAPNQYPDTIPGTPPRYEVYVVLSSYEADDTSDVAALGSVWACQRHEVASVWAQLPDAISGPESLFAPGIPTSAWHVRQMLISTSNAIIARHTQSICVAVFGSAVVEVPS